MIEVRRKLEDNNLSSVGRPVRLFAMLVLSGVSAGSYSGMAAAQALVTSTDAIRNCLCLEKNVADESEQLSLRRQAYEEKRREADSLDAQVAEQRPKVDTNDPDSVAAFRALLAKRDAAVEDVKLRQTPVFGVFVDRYNKSVASYNAQCSNQSFDSQTMKEVKANLTCPLLMGQPFLPETGKK